MLDATDPKTMTITLCEFDDVDTYRDVSLHDLTEEHAQEVVIATVNYFKEFLDQAPWRDVGYVSRRAENVLVRNQAMTLADVKRILIRATSTQGVQGAGRLVQHELTRLCAGNRG